ncbi:permease-like cell division protein FtsX [Liquorilactobacillus satsumensis]|uniref:Cell division protein FtsX n=1 Tax=Liquorilactobacillus satsumensis DSM 16230 = JCM 12392 TaxID=1423801 RepID=A0A0R1V3D4_9LACO|nr:permease-like cell division protein FtsX [Liquorilactobacillus satsumensis]KRM00206.1 cell-division associated ABC transporter, membrane FtsX subunit [Liquorilactobacillus satsumensis DSM 16230 = JCM 12392]MCC7665767.1 ABC transporter permease [Liquorilactobacillus satsumensis]MCP9313428.1 permease-like cell division protein FtsX [Liquorilactobacillus satsumensis]MCP9328219.1 permease-like cell division protein FtsX [Liquorilactobacillus satsumensis]MCP9356438.1 permease-like cell division 
MKLATFKRHLIESFKSLKRNGWMSVAAFSAVTVTLLLVGVLLSVLMNVNKIAADVENDVQVRVLINRGTTQAQQTKLKNKLEKLAEVKKITFSSKENELSKVVKSYGKGFKLFGGDGNPLYDVFIVQAKKPQQTVRVAQQAKKMSFVYDAKYGGTSAKKMFAIVDNIQKWGLGISLLLLFVAVFLISNTIRITILSRQNEISIMRLVGATNSFIRWPFILEGAWTGLFGAVIPLVIVNFGYVWTHRVLSQALASTSYRLLTPGTFLLEIDALLILIGIFIGALGAGFSMRRFLKI